ncbi:MAG TPA: transporter substrate-binding domain-containing protein [Stellaceae bacterium]|nr:transporter substrate-binding domain-containing protein [Stellaceae bacterium]
MARQRATACVAGLLFVVGVLCELAGSALGASPVPAEARAQLVPTGKLRAAILTYDPALGSREAAGAPGGVEGDLARMLADRLGVPLQPIFYDLPAGYAASIGALAWDIAFAGREVAGRVDYGPAILLVEHALLLAPGKSFQDLADLDREKVRVGVTIGTVDDLFLAQRLHKAFLFRVLVGTDAASLALRASGADVFAGSVPFLTKVAESAPGSRIAGPPFAVVPVMVAVSPGRTSALGYVSDFIREAKTTGLIQEAINRAKLTGVSVAPP